MKTLKIILLCMLTLNLVSCDADDIFEDDFFEDYYEGGLSIVDFESKLVGREWTGDLGMNAPNREPIYSSFFFGSHHSGVEYQYYSRDGRKCAEYRFKWHTEYCQDCGARSIVLNYGGGDVSFMDEVYFSRRYTLSGIYCYSIGDKGIHFNLEMMR